MTAGGLNPDAGAHRVDRGRSVKSSRAGGNTFSLLAPGLFQGCRWSHGWGCDWHGERRHFWPSFSDGRNG